MSPALAASAAAACFGRTCPVCFCPSSGPVIRTLGAHRCAASSPPQRRRRRRRRRSVSCTDAAAYIARVGWRRPVGPILYRAEWLHRYLPPIAINALARKAAQPLTARSWIASGTAAASETYTAPIVLRVNQGLPSAHRNGDDSNDADDNAREARTLKEQRCWHARIVCIEGRYDLEVRVSPHITVHLLACIASHRQPVSVRLL